MIDFNRANPPDDDDPQRGEGGHTLAERRNGDLMRRAIKQRWDIPKTKRKSIMNTLIEIGTNKANSNRDRINACRGLLQAEAQNQADEHKLMPDKHIHAHGVIIEHLSDEEIERLIAASVGATGETPSTNGLNGIH